MEKKENRTNRIALLALLLYFVETTLDGTGRAIDFGFISIQMILFAFACLFTLPPFIKRFRETMLNPCVISAIVFGIAVIVWTYVGFKRGNNPAYIRQDVTSVMAFALLPGTVATIDSRKKLDTAVNVFFYCTLIAAFTISALYFINAFAPQAVAVFNKYADVKLGGTIEPDRSYFRTEVFMIPGICLGVMKLREKESAGLYLAEGLMIFTILLSGTRSFWLGLAVALLAVLALNVKDFLHFLKYGLISTAIAGLLIAASSFFYGELTVIPTLFGRNENVTALEEIDYSVAPAAKDSEATLPMENFDGTREEELISGNDFMHYYGSDTLRTVILSRLRYNIKKYFFTGAGLGFDIKLQRGGKTEYMYLDFMMKMGIIGFISFLAAFFTPVFLCLKRIFCELRTPNSELTSSALRHCGSSAPVTCHLSPATAYLLAGYLGIAVTSYFNPFLTNPMGIMILSILAASVTIDNDKQKQKTT